MSPAELQRLADQIVNTAHDRIARRELPAEWVEGYAIGQLSLVRSHLIDYSVADLAACIAIIERAIDEVRAAAGAAK